MSPSSKAVLATFVMLVALTLAVMAGVSIGQADRTCVSAPIGGVVATWCGNDVPPPSAF